MMVEDEITGRFLPSRAYGRWKWAVRFGLLIVPMLVLLGGGLVLFLTPLKYRSTAVVEIKNARSPQESANLLTSSAILGCLISDLRLGEQFQVDQLTAREILTDTVQVKVIPDTRLIEISVLLVQKELARDIAAALPRSLARFEGDRVRDEHTAKVAKLDQLILDARDAAAESAVGVTRIEKIHGGALPETPAFRELERARRASLLADSEVERLKILRAAAVIELVDIEPLLIVHSEPVISQSPSNPKTGPELDQLLLHALAAGLTAALLLPYLCELAFPAQKGSQMISDVVYDL
ncbi:MAG: hypothetical protein WEB53_05205 [Akkermansiaceae bacterium]